MAEESRPMPKFFTDPNYVRINQVNFRNFSLLVAFLFKNCSFPIHMKIKIIGNLFWGRSFDNC